MICLAGKPNIFELRLKEHFEELNLKRIYKKATTFKKKIILIGTLRADEQEHHTNNLK